MMKNLIYKELRLTVHPTMWIFLALTAMLLIPSYPYYVVFFYMCLAIYFTFLSAREERDVYFTAMLPVTKGDMVKARVIVMCLFELLALLVSLPFAVLSLRINHGNAAGIDINFAFYGLVFLLFGGFHLCFLPCYYKTGHKLGKPLFFGGIFIFGYIFVVEAMAQYIPSPLSAWLDAPANPSQLPLLFGGAALYAGLTWLACRVSIKRFERVDL